MAIKYGTSSPDEITADSGDLNAQLFGYEEGDLTQGPPSDNDVLIGGEGDDSLNGGSGDDLLQGGGGNDSLYGGDGADTLIGGDGNDNYYDVGPDDIIVEYPMGDTFPGAGFLDEVSLAAGVTNFSLSGHDGIEVVHADMDTAVVLDGNNGPIINVLHGSAQGDTLSGHGGLDLLAGHGGDDTLDGGVGFSELSGGNGNDTYVINLTDTVLGGAPLSEAGWMNYVTIIEDVDGSNLDGIGTSDNDVVRLMGFSISDVVFSVRGEDLNISSSITGQLLATVGGMFEGYAGNYQKLVETFVFDDGSVLASDLLAQYQIPSSAPSDIGFIGDHIIAHDIVDAGAGDDVVEGTAGNDSLNGGGGHDELTGGDGNDTLHGGAGSDTLNGGAGDDLLDGGFGPDYDGLSGGNGNDTYWFGRGYGDDLIIESLDGDGAETGTADRLVLRNVNSDEVTFQVEDYYLIGVIPMDSLKITINDTGESIMIAGQLVDTDASGNPVDYPYFGVEYIEFANGVVWGVDDIRAAADGNPPDYDPPVPPTVATEGDDILVGTELNDSEMPFNDIANNPQSAINGLGGNDTISMLAGDDIAAGGAGNDTISGGDGNDILLGSGIDLSTMQFTDTAGMEVLSGNAGDDIYFVLNDTTSVIESSGEGTDTVYENVAFYAAPENVENVFAGALEEVVADAEGVSDPMGDFFSNASGVPLAVSIVGNALDNVIVGNALDNMLSGLDGDDRLFGQDGNDQLDGGLGADRLVGGLGDDVYIVDNAGDVVVEHAGEGYDSVQSSVSFDGSIADIEDIHLTGSNDINATGNALDNVLIGNDAANRLDGGAGIDVMVGGLGDDTYVVENAFDAVIENASSGIDTVEAGISYTLGSNVENLVLTGVADINGTGNSLANVITGNAGGNTLSGGAGADTLVGGLGNDTYIFGAGDTIIEHAGEGIDTVRSAVTHTLGANLENLVLTGTGNTNGFGNDLVNTIVGNAGNNRLNGGAGADTLMGGVGDDTYIYGSGDMIIEQAGEGVDTVRSSQAYVLGSNLENLTLTGGGNINGTGNALDNVLTGNGGANVLVGGGGHDVLSGVGGADTLIGGAGNDTYVLNRGDGADTVVENDSSAGNHDVAQFGSSGEAINAEQLWFSQSGNDLLVSVVGSNDQFTFTNWYAGDAQHVEEFRVSDGSSLTDAQVNNLVSAMSSFTPPAVGTANLDAGYQPVLDAIAASWS